MRLFEPGIEAAPIGPLRRVMLLVAYDGSSFHGFAAQPGQRTVGGTLAAILASMAGHEVSVTCAGRTDAGVHAQRPGRPRRRRRGDARPLGRPRAQGGHGPASSSHARSATSSVQRLAVLEARVAPEGFDARHSALTRRYRYDLLRTPWPDPLLRHSSWHVPGELDLAAMRIAADALLGEHDFAAFCRRRPWRACADHAPRAFELLGARPGRRAELVLPRSRRTPSVTRWSARSSARSSPSGQGRMRAGELLAILRGADRSRSSQPAPPQGLCLVGVRYPEALVPGGTWDPGGADRGPQNRRSPACRGPAGLLSLSPGSCPLSLSFAPFIAVAGRLQAGITGRHSNKGRLCARIPPSRARSSASGASSTPTAWFSAGSRPRSHVCSAASTGRSSPRTSTPVTTSSSSTPPRSS